MDQIIATVKDLQGKEVDVAVGSHNVAISFMIPTKDEDGKYQDKQGRIFLPLEAAEIVENAIRIARRKIDKRSK